MFEETGVDARILTPISGEFAGTTIINRYFLMTVDKRPVKLDFSCDENASLRWAWPQKARELIVRTSDQLGRKRDLAALACLPSPPPLKRPMARREDWSSTNSMPAACQHLLIDKVYSSDEMAKIRRGFVPESQNDKWFVYYEDDSLLMHRAWGNTCQFRVEFAPLYEKFGYFISLGKMTPEATKK